MLRVRLPCRVCVLCIQGCALAWSLCWPLCPAARALVPRTASFASFLIYLYIVLMLKRSDWFACSSAQGKGGDLFAEN